MIANFQIMLARLGKNKTGFIEHVGKDGVGNIGSPGNFTISVHNLALAQLRNRVSISVSDCG